MPCLRPARWWKGTMKVWKSVSIWHLLKNWDASWAVVDKKSKITSDQKRGSIVSCEPFAILWFQTYTFSIKFGQETSVLFWLLNFSTCFATVADRSAMRGWAHKKQLWVAWSELSFFLYLLKTKEKSAEKILNNILQLICRWHAKSESNLSKKVKKA